MTGAPPRNLDEVLTQLGSKLEEWEARALFLGAQASTNVRLGPQHLLGHLFEGAPVLGDTIDDAKDSRNGRRFKPTGKFLASNADVCSLMEDGEVR